MQAHDASKLQAHNASTLLEAQLKLPTLHKIHFVTPCSHLEHAARACQGTLAAAAIGRVYHKCCLHPLHQPCQLRCCCTLEELLAGVAIQQMGLEPRHICPREHCITMLATVLHLPWHTPVLLPSHILILHPEILILASLLRLPAQSQACIGWCRRNQISGVSQARLPKGCSSPLDLPAIGHDGLQIYFWVIGEEVLNGACPLSLHVLA